MGTHFWSWILSHLFSFILVVILFSFLFSSSFFKFFPSCRSWTEKPPAPLPDRAWDEEASHGFDWLRARCEHCRPCGSQKGNNNGMVGQQERDKTVLGKREKSEKEKKRKRKRKIIFMDLMPDHCQYWRKEMYPCLPTLCTKKKLGETKGRHSDHGRFHSDKAKYIILKIK